MVGAKSDSHQFIAEAVEKGAAAVLVERETEADTKEAVVILTENSRIALARMAEVFFGNPLSKLQTIAVTGTKGKTTVTHMIRELLEHSGKKTGVIGTMGAYYTEAKTGRMVQIKTPNTTPESYELYRIFRQMADAGVTHVALEVSSQAYLMHRVEGMEFDYGVFTNLSPDHIGEGEHPDFADYLRCKSLLFRHCKTGILNRDDAHMDEILQYHTCRVTTFGMEGEADLTGYDAECVKEPGFIGVTFRTAGLYQTEIRLSCMGRFNVYNAMAAMAVSSFFAVPAETVREEMSHIAVRGRVEPVHVSDHFHVIIDYAHNALSAESLFQTMLEYHPTRLVCVFGAGGNRSKLRRYDMGEIAGRYADFSIVTSDNPRFEEPEAIIQDILIGMKKTDGAYITIVNRRDAIRYSLEHAEEGDLIVLFGKGHEDYQEIRGIRYPFDERTVVAEIWKEIGGDQQWNH
jgi:UDP-N-acetylmuramoyl-L-alanyl-D-glutamate--2,6-diaminopimelate ligase